MNQTQYVITFKDAARDEIGDHVCGNYNERMLLEALWLDGDASEVFPDNAAFANFWERVVWVPSVDNRPRSFVTGQYKSNK